MLQALVNFVKDTAGIQTPGRISAIGLENDSVPALDTLSGSLRPILVVGSGKVGLPVMPACPVIGYRFDCRDGAERTSGVLSPETYQRVVEELSRQEQLYGRVVEFPAELGGAGLSVSIPVPNADTIEND